MLRFRPPFAIALLIAAPVSAQPSAAGLYRAAAGPDVASAIELAPDGRFRYERSEGALDEEASGRWTQTADGAVLDTLPHPRAPEWQINTIEEAKDSPLTVTVKVPAGDRDSLAGIYIRIGFTNGDRQAGMTQFDGWKMDAAEQRQPAWIELSEPVHGVSSQRFDLPARKNMAIVVTIMPNDIGVAAFDKTPVTMTKDGIMLHWRGREIPYSRVGKGQPRSASSGITITGGVHQ